MDIVSFAIGMSAAGDKTELLENVEIPVDFSNGNQTIEAEEGKAIKSAVIQKPETLVAENIAKDINIAGIIGTLESGGGEGKEDVAKKVVEGGYAEINLPNAEKIKQYAFYKETALTHITMPKVKSIGTYAFYDCNRLPLTSLPSGVTEIGIQAFWGCSKLALTYLPNGITSISSSAFCYCTDLALTYLPNGITSIGSQAFQNCTNLAVTSLPSGITSIGSSAFKNCTGLTSITFEGKPNSIYNNAFTGCTNLITINVPWAEGEVANAPWGATAATINYNYTGE